MSNAKPHPIVAAFGGLLDLRRYLAKNPRDGAARFVAYCATHHARSYSQLFQDLLVTFFLKEKRNGYFVEFGATNGVNLSNTCLLERHYEWHGILAEPARCWHDSLRKNRKEVIDTRCVWSESGLTLQFKETVAKEFSTIDVLADRDFHRDLRASGTVYPVTTISLNDLLREHQSPAEIDYLSVDTEGSELPILRAFNFDAYDVKIITVEHNYCEPARGEILGLLTAKGFVRLFENFSRFDDWYVKKSIIGL